MWYIDSGCSRHMSGDKSLFVEIKMKNYGHVTFGDNNKGKIIGIDKVGKEPLPTIDNVYLVDGLQHNLLSVLQLCYNYVTWTTMLDLNQLIARF